MSLILSHSGVSDFSLEFGATVAIYRDEKCRWIQRATGYLVSESGHVISLRQRQPRLLSHGVQPRFGHRHVLLNGRHAEVHHLVLEAFVGPRPDGSVCRHLDGNPANNHWSNLAWGSYQENADDREVHGKTYRVYGEANHATKYSLDTILAVHDLRSEGLPYRVVAERTGMSLAHARRIACGLTRRYG